MTVKNNQTIVTNNLVLLYDAASKNSFQGTPTINLLTGFATDVSAAAYYIVEPSYQDEYIPAIGWVNTLGVDIYNNYPAGWNGCCPAPIQYTQGYGAVPLSPSTQYTYQIIYKTSDGYYHPNYMYRYELLQNGGYVTEGNVGDFGVNGNRISLGNDWYMAWGTFTTQATTAQAAFRCFHYKYNVFTRLQIAAATVRQGSLVLPAKYMMNPGLGINIGSSPTTGGGWLDLSGNDYHATLNNNPTFSTDKGGAVEFNGTNQFISANIGNINFDREQTIIMVLKKTTNLTNRQNPWNQNYGGYGTMTFETSGQINYYWGSAGADGNPYTQLTSSFYVADNELAFIAITRNPTTMTWYKNGIASNSTANTIPRAVAGNTTLQIGLGYAGYFGGNIYYVSAYNRSLTAAEIKQNFDALKGRFGLV